MKEVMNQLEQVHAEASPVSLSAAELVLSHFGRHPNKVVAIEVDYDLVEQSLRLAGTPSKDTSPEVARRALEDALAAATFIHPADNLDSSV
jgi:hypothetical protein